jgi:hypothetical protein
MALAPGANTAKTFRDNRQFALVRAQKPRERFKSGWVIDGPAIISLGGDVQTIGRPNEVRHMGGALVTDQLIMILGPREAKSFTKAGDAAGNFKIVNGNQLRAAKAVPSGAYSVGAIANNWQDEAGSTRTVTIFVDPRPPTDIALSGAGTIAVASAVNAVVGSLTSTDPEAGDTFTYTGADAGGYLKIGGVGNAQVLVAKALPVAGTGITIPITSTDAAGLAFTKSFLVTVV